MISLRILTTGIFGIWAALTFAPGHVSACSPDGKEGILPENSLKVGLNALETSGIDEKIYDEIIGRIEEVYAPVVAAKGGHLKIERKWSDDKVNSYARRVGSDWYVDILGGLARHPSVTPDALALVVCHELGHHLGGAPKFVMNWAAVEGEADYFAALKCMRTVFGNDDFSEYPTTPPTVTEKCQKSYTTAADIRVCERTSMAGLALGELFASLDGAAAPSFDTPDPSIALWTYSWHPAAQCRLDTYFQGAICDKSPADELGGADPTVGACAIENGATFGYRPLCWYHPKSS